MGKNGTVEVVRLLTDSISECGGLGLRHGFSYSDGAVSGFRATSRFGLVSRSENRGV